MKLYTEEQVKEAIYMSEYRAMHESEIIKLLTPIELPSDEVIDDECRKLPFEKHLDDGQYNDGQIDGFELGAKWMKQQIQGGNK